MRITLLTLIGGLLTASWASAEPLMLHVAPNGDDTWSGLVANPEGGADGPFATLERARDEVRQLRQAGKLPSGPVTVNLRGGVYWRERTFELTAADSGTKDAPIVYMAYGDESVRLLGGREVKDWKPVSDPAVLKRLDESAHGHVLEADLKAAGVTDFGKLTPRGFGRPVTPAGLELFYRDAPMPLAHWPNEGYVKIAGVPDGPKGGKFAYDGDRPKRWAQAEDIWLHGYWTWDWAESYEKVKRIDVEKREISTVSPHGVYGYKAGQRWRALNLLEELDSPGEWYLDRTTGRLYFWPPSSEGQAEGLAGPVYVSVVNDLITARDVSYVRLAKLGLEVARGNSVVIEGGTCNLVLACTLRNLGNRAVTIENATASGVERCEISATGDGGITLNGGDRRTLTSAGLFAANNHIWNFSRWSKTYRPAVSVHGVGNRVSNNLIHNGPHMAIALGGNEHLIQGNEIHSVCLETDDVGAFYMGRDYTQRGNVIRYNYFHDLGGVSSHVGTMAIYLDDWSSGTTVFGNICVRAGRAVLIGGGRDNTVENNIFVDCKPAVHIDQRGLGWAKYYFDGTDKTLTERLAAMPYQESPWRERYPELLTLYQDEPAKAKGNKVVHNICVGGRWLDLLDGLRPEAVVLEGNLTDQDPHFVDAAKGDYRLKEDSPAWKLGFERIPMEAIGLNGHVPEQEFPRLSR